MQHYGQAPCISTGRAATSASSRYRHAGEPTSSGAQELMAKKAAKGGKKAGRSGSWPVHRNSWGPADTRYKKTRKNDLSALPLPPRRPDNIRRRKDADDPDEENSG